MINNTSESHIAKFSGGTRVIVRRVATQFQTDRLACFCSFATLRRDCVVVTSQLERRRAAAVFSPVRCSYLGARYVCRVLEK
jgi:hypothetical protein